MLCARKPNITLSWEFFTVRYVLAYSMKTYHFIEFFVKGVFLTMVYVLDKNGIRS